MTLSATLQQKLADWRPATPNETLTVTVDGWTAVVNAERCETLGCLVRELTLGHSLSTESPAPPLKDWAERVAIRVTGLLEPLRLLEVDDGKRIAILRSNEPARREDELSYYELLLDGNGAANLQRYRASHSSRVRREAVSFALTHESLARLASDIVACRA